MGKALLAHTDNHDLIVLGKTGVFTTFQFFDLSTPKFLELVKNPNVGIPHGYLIHKNTCKCGYGSCAAKKLASFFGTSGAV